MALAAWCASLALPASAAPVAAPAAKVLRIASESETGFDPARVGDARSFRVIAHIFEPLLRYDPLARPVRLQPLTAQALPEPSPDFRTWTVRLRPGILFTDDPAFGGRPRELVAADYAYTLRRLADPANKSPGWSSLEQAGISGLAALRREAIDRKRSFDYDRPVPGLQVER
jgi:ABC-type transport system substrate-binding protein